MQRRYNSNPTFLDFIQITALGFITLFLIAFMLINPIAETGKIDPKTEFMATIEWDENITHDIDIWMKGPDGTVVGYQRKDGRYIVLDRDDLGGANDTFVVNGVSTTVKRNLETVTINTILPGEYVINVHYFGGGMERDAQNRPYFDKEPVDVRVEFMDVNPFKVLYSEIINISYRQEMTVITFVVNDKGEVKDIRTDVNIPIYGGIAGRR